MVFVLNLAEYHSDVNRFKLALRDFLIQLKEFSDDNAELFVDEKEAEAARKAQQEREGALKIPGMLKPSHTVFLSRFHGPYQPHISDVTRNESSRVRGGECVRSVYRRM